MIWVIISIVGLFTTAHLGYLLIKTVEELNSERLKNAELEEELDRISIINERMRGCV